jgi:hypothetical protein
MPAPQKPAASVKLAFTKIPTKQTGHRITLYGPGGIGKTSLCANLPGLTAFFDLEESLSRLRTQLGELADNVVVVPDINSWSDMRRSLQSDGWDNIKNIVIDTGTKAEELCVAHTVATIKHEKGHSVSRVEDYGFGKGYQFVFDTFLPLLGDLDVHCRAGRNVVIVAHDCTTTVPNPQGEDWLRYEPRLQSPNSGKGSIRLRIKEWSDHLLFFGYDVAVDKDGKGKGQGTRTIHPSERPHCMAKSRTTSDPIAVEIGADVWSQILK